MEPTTAGSPESGDTSPGLVTVDTNDSVITNGELSSVGLVARVYHWH